MYDILDFTNSHHRHGVTMIYDRLNPPDRQAHIKSRFTCHIPVVIYYYNWTYDRLLWIYDRRERLLRWELGVVPALHLSYTHSNLLLMVYDRLGWLLRLGLEVIPVITYNCNAVPVLALNTKIISNGDNGATLKKKYYGYKN